METVLSSRTRSNLVNAIVGSGYSASEPRYSAWGIGPGNASATDVALFDPVGSPVLGTYGTTTTSTSGDTFFCNTVLTASGFYEVTNVGLFDNNSTPAVGQLTSQVNPGQTTLSISNYDLFPSSYPFYVQVLTEVMTVVSGNGSNVFDVIRGTNGSSILTTIIPSFTPVVGPAGNLFIKSSFAGISLNFGDSIEFNISVQFA